MVLLRDVLCHLIPACQIFLQLPKLDSLYQELANNMELRVLLTGVSLKLKINLKYSSINSHGG